jgi:hypothetical protein
LARLFECEVTVGGGFDIGGLTVYPLTGVRTGAPSYLTGPEAFEAGLITVSELDPPQVPLLAVTNLADVLILLVEGEMLVGGDQNRTMNVTVLIPPRATTVVPVSCVEAGRWGARRAVSSSRSHAPGSIRAAKTAHLELRTGDGSGRRSDQHRVWDEVERRSLAHGVESETSALQDVLISQEVRIADQLDHLTPVRDQIGVVCAVGDRVVGLDLFDKPSTLEQYLRGIVAGHALDAEPGSSAKETVEAIERFLARVDRAVRDVGGGVGLGTEMLLHGDVTGIGLVYDNCLVHMAAFPASDDLAA